MLQHQDQVVNLTEQFQFQAFLQFQKVIVCEQRCVKIESSKLIAPRKE
jgi:hypothetical protein